MPTKIHVPTAVGDEDQWVLGAGASKTAAVLTSDGDTTHIACNTIGDDFQLFTMDDLPASAGQITSVSFSNISSIVAGGGVIVGRRKDSTGAAADIGAAPGAPHAYTLTTTNAPTAVSGAAWTPAIVNSIQAGVHGNPDGVDTPSNYRCTQVFATTVYIAAQGAFVFDLIAALGLLGGGLTRGDIPGLFTAFNRVSKLLKFLPDEYDTAWEDIREHKYPVRVFYSSRRDDGACSQEVDPHFAGRVGSLRRRPRRLYAPGYREFDRVDHRTVRSTHPDLPRHGRLYRG